MAGIDPSVLFIAAVLLGIIIYLSYMRKNVKRFVLRSETIEKYFR